MTTRHALTSAALVLALVSCGGGGSENGSGGAKKASEDINFNSARSIAEALGEGGFACVSIESANMIGPKDAVQCSHEQTGDISVAVFTSGEDRDQLLDQMAGVFGTVDPEQGGAVKGDPAWIVSVGSQAEAEQVQGILGGETV